MVLRETIDLISELLSRETQQDLSEFDFSAAPLPTTITSYRYHVYGEIRSKYAETIGPNKREASLNLLLGPHSGLRNVRGTCSSCME